MDPDDITALRAPWSGPRPWRPLSPSDPASLAQALDAYGSPSGRLQTPPTPRALDLAAALERWPVSDVVSGSPLNQTLPAAVAEAPASITAQPPTSVGVPASHSSEGDAADWANHPGGWEPGASSAARLVRAAFGQAVAPAPNNRGMYIWPLPGGGAPAVRGATGSNGLEFSDGRYSPDGSRRGGRPHYGVDLPAAYGDPVVAAGDGVLYSQGTANGWGRYVAIRHDDGYISVYAHLSAVAPLKVGAQVSQGQPIAYVGQSGNAAGRGTHLHLEIRKDIGPYSLSGMSHGRAIAVDPTKWIDGSLGDQDE